MKVKHFLLSGVTLALLAACGSDNNSRTKSEPQIPSDPVQPEETVEKAGRIIGAGEDVADATVFYDLDGDLIADEAEAVSAVDARGNYKLRVKKSNSGRGKIVARINDYPEECLLYEDLCGYALVSPYDDGIVSGLTTMLDHMAAMNPGTAATSPENIARLKSTYDLHEAPDVDFETLQSAPQATPEKRQRIRRSKRVDGVIQEMLKTFTTPSEVNINIGNLNLNGDTEIETEINPKVDVHNTILHHLTTESGKKLITKAMKFHEQHEDYADMDYGSWPKNIQDLFTLKPEHMPQLLPLTKAMMTGEKGNLAEYISTDGFNTLGYGDPEGDEHAPSRSVAHYDKENEKTHLANYYLKHESGNIYFQATSEPRPEDHFVLDTTAVEWKKSKHRWDVKEFDLNTGRVVLNNPYNTFVSRTPTSQLHDLSGQSLNMYLQRNPELNKTWGHLVDGDAEFAEGSKVHRISVTNNKQVFLIPDFNDCKSDDDVYFAVLSDGGDKKKLCNFVLTTEEDQDGNKELAKSFDDIFVPEFSSAEDIENANVDGVIVGMDGSTYLIAQLKRANDEKRGNIKFFKSTPKIQEDGEFKHVITEFPTSVATTWETQTIGSDGDAIELCRVTVPEEVLSFGREVKMASKHAFLAAQGEGNARALRHGIELQAGMILPETPYGLNAIAVNSLLDNVDPEKFKTHEHKEFYAEELCHAGNSLMKDKATRQAHDKSMKTRDQYHEAARQCKSHDEKDFKISELSEQRLTLSKHIEDPIRKIEFAKYDEGNNTGKAKIFKEMGAPILYEFDATYLYDADSDSAKVTYTTPEDGKKRHLYLTLIKRVEKEDDIPAKLHFKTLHIIDGEKTGVVGHQVYLIDENPTPTDG